MLPGQVGHLWKEIMKPLLFELNNECANISILNYSLDRQDMVCHRVASGILASSCCIKSLKIRLDVS